MPALQRPIDFRFKDDSRPPTLPVVKERLQGVLWKVLGEDGWSYLQQDLDKGGFVLLMIKSNGCRVTYQQCGGELIATLDIFEPLHSQETESVITAEVAEELKAAVGKGDISDDYDLYVPVKRGWSPHPYYPTDDERLNQYNIINMHCDVRSRFQSVRVIETIEHGSVLVLDNDINIGESDEVYARAITGSGREDYQGKAVLILGGGDCGVLREVLKHSPKFVTMVEIDEVVLVTCKKYLRGVCGNLLDSYDGGNCVKGEKFEIKVQDCVPVLKQYVSDGVKFDYIISDLTAAPISTDPNDSCWEFLRLIMDLAVQVLSAKGALYTQVASQGNSKSIVMYNRQLSQLRHSVQFSSDAVPVPSYMENWVFYRIWRTDVPCS